MITLNYFNEYLATFTELLVKTNLSKRRNQINPKQHASVIDFCTMVDAICLPGSNTDISDRSILTL